MMPRDFLAAQRDVAGFAGATADPTTVLVRADRLIE
jgi:hypothetical protein